jgi:hypothetical protein
MALGLMSQTTVVADLKWDSTQIELSATAGDQEVIAEFPFTNATSTPISITHVETSCDCTVGQPSASVIAPGGKGYVRAVFTLGDRVGKQQKTIDVFTDVASTKPVTLVLRVNIADVVTSHPRMLLWKVREPPVEKVVEFHPVGSRSIRSIAPPAETPGFSCRLEADPATNTFRLHVTPKSTDGSINTVIPLTAEVEGRPPTGLAVYASVR